MMHQVTLIGTWYLAFVGDRWKVSQYSKNRVHERYQSCCEIGFSGLCLSWLSDRPQVNQERLQGTLSAEFGIRSAACGCVLNEALQHNLWLIRTLSGELMSAFRKATSLKFSDSELDEQFLEKRRPRVKRLRRVRYQQYFDQSKF